jgi:hypothetical protein
VLFFNKPKASIPAAFAAILAAAALAGCGSSGDASTTAPAPAVSKADLHEAQVKSQRLAKLYERSWREYQGE